MSDNVLTSSPKPGICLIRLNRPERRNALNVATISALGEVFSAAEIDDNVRCVVITGNDKAFSAGAGGGGGGGGEGGEEGGGGLRARAPPYF